MNADWSSSAALPVEPVRGEHLVPVVADPAAGPAVPAAARQPHRVGVGRAEERLGRGGAPVEQQPAARAVGEAEPPDVHGLGVVRADDVPEAQVQAEAAQGAQASGQPVDLHGPGPSPPGPCRRAPCARHRGGRTGRRSTARGSPRWPRSAARRRRSAPGRPWRRDGREGRTRWWSGVHVHQLRFGFPYINLGMTAHAHRFRGCLSGGQVASETGPPTWVGRGPRAEAGVGRPPCRSRRSCPGPAILRHDPVLAASPRLRYTWKWQGAHALPFFLPSSRTHRDSRTDECRLPASSSAPGTAGPRRRQS